MPVGHKKLCRHRMIGLEQAYLKVSPFWTCQGQPHVCQLSLSVSCVRDSSLLRTSSLFLLCWHNSYYIPIWTHLNDSVNCELLLKERIINHFQFCPFWKLVCFCKLWIFKYEQIQICKLQSNSKSFNERIIQKTLSFISLHNILGYLIKTRIWAYSEVSTVLFRSGGAE